MKLEELLLLISNNTQSNQEQYSSFDYTALVIAVATIVLVGVTYYYARQTKKLVTIQEESVKIMRESTQAQLKSVYAIKESTQAQFRPHIQIDLLFKKTEIPLIRVENIGIGAAILIEIRYKIKERNTEEEINIIPRLDKGDNKTIFLDSEGYKHNRLRNWYRDNQTTLAIKWKCKDILKTEFTGSDELNVSQLLLQRENEYDG